MKGKMIKASKISLLLVVIGFFMPVSCNCNGFELTRLFYRYKQIDYVFLILLVFVAATTSICITLCRKDKSNAESLVADWLLLIASISGGLFSIGRANREYFELQIGAWFIIIGWILSLIFLICASTVKGKISDNIDKDKYQRQERQDGT